MRAAMLFFLLLFSVYVVGALIPRLETEPAPNSREALEVKARAERLYGDMTTSDSLASWIRNKLIVQRVSYRNYTEQAGSCSGFSDRPKTDPSYDRYIDMEEIGLFGIRLKSWHAVCGGRVPLTRPIIVTQSKAEWEASVRAQQLENCKKHHLPCGALGDFRNSPGIR